MNERIALITGASRGIGLELCRQLAVAGLVTILTARDHSQGQRAADSLRGSVDFIPLDVADAGSIERAAAAVGERYDRLDVLINNAGISDDPGGALVADVGRLRRMMDVNFYGALLVSRALAPLLARGDDGRIINVTSGMGRLEKFKANHAGYRLSKAALNALTVLMARELEGSNVTVNAVSPGHVRTDMGGPSARLSVEEGAANVAWLATFDGEMPTGRYFFGREERPW